MVQQRCPLKNLISQNSLQNPAAPQRFSCVEKFATPLHVMAMAVQKLFTKGKLPSDPGLKTVLLRL